jgi:hypothetical protein
VVPHQTLRPVLQARVDPVRLLDHHHNQGVRHPQQRVLLDLRAQFQHLRAPVKQHHPAAQTKLRNCRVGQACRLPDRAVLQVVPAHRWVALLPRRVPACLARHQSQWVRTTKTRTKRMTPPVVVYRRALECQAVPQWEARLFRRDPAHPRSQ